MGRCSVRHRSRSMVTGLQRRLRTEIQSGRSDIHCSAFGARDIDPPSARRVGGPVHKRVVPRRWMEHAGAPHRGHRELTGPTSKKASLLRLAVQHRSRSVLLCVRRSGAKSPHRAWEAILPRLPVFRWSWCRYRREVPQSGGRAVGGQALGDVLACSLGPSDVDADRVPGESARSRQ